MAGTHHIERHDNDDSAPAETIVPNDQAMDLEQHIVVRLFPKEFDWVEVETEYLGPARPRIPSELGG